MPGSIYDKPTKDLFKEFVDSFVPPPEKGFKGLADRKPLDEGGYFKRKEILSWFQKHYPKLKPGTINAHLVLMSTNAPSRIHHNIRPNGADDLLFQINVTNFRLYDSEKDPSPIYKQSQEINEEDADNDEGDFAEGHEFAYEKDLKNFLASNLTVIRPSLALYRDGDIGGVEFDVGGRRIDILAVENEEDFVVIELKVSKGYDRTIGQLLRYMGWIEKNLADTGQRVKGMIVARTISDDLRLATSKVENVELFEYNLSISLTKIES